MEASSPPSSLEGHTFTDSDESLCDSMPKIVGNMQSTPRKEGSSAALAKTPTPAPAKRDLGRHGSPVERHDAPSMERKRMVDERSGNVVHSTSASASSSSLKETFRGEKRKRAEDESGDRRPPVAALSEALLGAEKVERVLQMREKLACQRCAPYNVRRIDRDGAAEEPINDRIADKLEAYAKAIEFEFDEDEKSRFFRSRRYRLAATALRKRRKQCSSIEKALRLSKDVRDIGDGISKTIAEIICNIMYQHHEDLGGHFLRNENLLSAGKYGIIEALCQIHGVAQTTAIELVRNHDITSICDLRSKVSRGFVSLTANQSTGLILYEDLLERIPRSEVDAIFKFVKSALSEISPSAKAHCCGSYRRGAPSCGDVDILICDHDFDPERANVALLKRLVLNLREKGFLTHDLTGYDDASSTVDDKMCGSYMGTCKVHRRHRRIDIKIYASKRLPFALLYFTGNDYSNRSMRFFAKKLGFSLSDKGIKYTGGAEVNHECSSEADIYTFWGLEYIPPNLRNP